MGSIGNHAPAQPDHEQNAQWTIWDERTELIPGIRVDPRIPDEPPFAKGDILTKNSAKGCK
jgi:hypothetical protein